MEPKLAIGVMVIITHSSVGMAGSIGTIVSDAGMVPYRRREGERHMWLVEFPRPITAWHSTIGAWGFYTQVAIADANLKPVSGLPLSDEVEAKEVDDVKSYLQREATRITKRLKDKQNEQ